jgi:hypothetical protein
VPKKVPMTFDPAKPFAGLGYRQIDTGLAGGTPRLTELPVKAGA